jgi:hypothetical protein
LFSFSGNVVFQPPTRGVYVNITAVTQDDIKREYPWRLRYNRKIIGNMIRLLVMNIITLLGPRKAMALMVYSSKTPGVEA